MTPGYYKQSNACLTPPRNMDESECRDLYVHRTDDGRCITMCKAPFWHRVKFLIHGRIWLGVLSGNTQPPVWLDCTATVFNNKDKSLWFKASKLLPRRERRKLKKV